MQLLGILFFIVAILYSSVGFGGGSTYTALLALFNVDYQLIPIISLSCNILVVSIGTVFYIKNRLLNNKLLFSLVIVSAPLSLLGGLLKINQKLFMLILASTLLLSGIALLMNQQQENSTRVEKKHHYWRLAIFISPIGLVSGITGIGGGIFLAPILHFFKLAKVKTIAATTCVFILVNSLFGLLGQWIKQSDNHAFNINALDYTAGLLLIAVFFGGIIGNRFAIKWLTPVQIRRLTAILILVVAMRLFISSF